jgi:hypothetical protein
MAAPSPLDKRNRRTMPVWVLCLVGVALLEGVSYLAVRYQERFRDLVAAPPLTDYQYKVPGASLWTLKPNYTATLAEIVEMKRRTEGGVGAEYLAQLGEKLGYKPGDTIFTIDSNGYKGPEIDQGHRRIRILTLGDSCTFGTLFDWYSYPRSMERALTSVNQPVEVVNAGVEAYTARHILMRINEFKGLRPEITTIFIGWTSLFSSSGVPLKYSPNTFKVLEKIYSRLAPMSTADPRPMKPDRDDPDLKRLDNYTPDFVHDVEDVVKEMRSVGSQVVIVTLPGLYDLDEVPSPTALKTGYLPTFTDNPYFLAKMTARYNDWLRGLAAREHLPLIDLDRWAKTELRPRDIHFADSVHLYEEGEQQVGDYMASQLAGLVGNVRAAKR